MSNIHTYTPIHWLYFPRSSLSDAMYHIELNNFYDECVRELICFFSAFGLFLFLFVSFFFLFCFALFCFFFLLQFTSVPMPYHDMPLFIRLSHFKRVFFYFPLSFLFELITCIAQKNYDVFYGMCFSFSNNVQVFFFFFQPEESRINLK